MDTEHSYRDSCSELLNAWADQAVAVAPPLPRDVIVVVRALASRARVASRPVADPAHPVAA